MRAVIVVTARLPDCGQARRPQHALARLAVLRRERAHHRVGFAQACASAQPNSALS